MFTVYVLFSPAHNKTYVGFTSNLAERLKSHNDLGHKGWTLRYRPWQLLYSETFTTKKAAMAREKALKSGQGRAFIKVLLAQQ
jgi:putative endonuclease